MRLPSENPVNFVIITLIIGYLVIRYGKPALNGVLRKRMRTPGLVSFNADKYYELDGLGALFMGITLLVFCTCLVLFWLNFTYSYFFK